MSDQPIREILVGQNALSHLESARDVMGKTYMAFCAKRNGGANSAELQLLIDKVAALHNDINSLCWLVIEYQADQDEVLPGTFSSAEELFKAMRLTV